MTFEIIYHIMYHLIYIIIETRPFRAEVRKNQAWCRSVNNLSGQPLQQWRHLTKSFWCTCSTASTSSTVPTSRLLPLFPKMFKNHLTDELNLTRESVTKWLSCLVCCNKDLNVASSSRNYALPGLRIKPHFKITGDLWVRNVRNWLRDIWWGCFLKNGLQLVLG